MTYGWLAKHAGQEVYNLTGTVHCQASKLDSLITVEQR